MIALSATDLAIRLARENGTLRITESEGRFGTYWAIEDDHGLIEVAMTKAEADRRIASDPSLSGNF